MGRIRDLFSKLFSNKKLEVTGEIFPDGVGYINPFDTELPILDMVAQPPTPVPHMGTIGYMPRTSYIDNINDIGRPFRPIMSSGSTFNSVTNEPEDVFEDIHKPAKLLKRK